MTPRPPRARPGKTPGSQEPATQGARGGWARARPPRFHSTQSAAWPGGFAPYPPRVPSNLPSNIAHIGRTIRNIRRAREIIGVLVSFGFGEAVRDLELDRLVQRGRRMVGLGAKEAVSSDVQRKPTAVRLREDMEELGLTFVKL